MKKRISRMISAALALALCLVMSLIPASAAEAETSSGASGSASGFTSTVVVEGVSFYVSGDTFAVGSQLTVGTADLEEGDMWSLNIHFTQSGSADHYAAVTPEGEMTELFTANQVNDYYEYLTIPSEETRTFTLTIPEEYADWNVAIRFGYNNSFGELPLEEREDVSFTDVAEGDWFAPFVIPAANAGWFSGNPDGSFGPNQSLTVAQVVVLAARLHSAHTNDEIPAAAEGEAWYMPYYNYCLEKGIFAAEDGYLEKMDDAATRFEMAAIWDKAAYPPRVTGGVNEVADGFIPDLAEGDEYGEIIYRWYRSGVLTGDAQYRFNGESSITRAEASVIICHLIALVETAKI